jgi:hypothetical protein
VLLAIAGIELFFCHNALILPAEVLIDEAQKLNFRTF